MVCLPGDPGAALIGFEVLARPVIQLLAGAEPVFRPSVRAHLLETVVVARRAARVPPGARRRAARRRLHGAAARRRAVHAVRAGRGQRAAGARRAGRPPRPPALLWTCCCWTGGGDVAVRVGSGRGARAGPRCSPTAPVRAAAVPALRRRRLVARCAVANEAWLAPWEPTPPGGLGRAELAGRVPAGLPRPAPRRPAHGEAMPFAVCLRERRPGAAGRPHQPGQHRAAGVLLRRTPATGSTPGWPAGASSRPRWRSPSTTPSAPAGCTGSRSTSGRRTRPAGGWWRSSASARRRTTRATCTSTAPGGTTSDTR